MRTEKMDVPTKIEWEYLHGRFNLEEWDGVSDEDAKMLCAEEIDPVDDADVDLEFDISDLEFDDETNFDENISEFVEELFQMA